MKLSFKKLLLSSRDLIAGSRSNDSILDSAIKPQNDVKFLKCVLVLIFFLPCFVSCQANQNHKKIDQSSIGKKEILLNELTKMAQESVSDRVMLAWVQQVDGPVALDVQDIIKLKNANVPERVIRSLIEAKSKK